jgi:hypothetical protein
MAYDQTKPANNSALTSPEIRANFASLQAALGNPDAVPLSPAVAVQFISPPTWKPGGLSTYSATGVGLYHVDTTAVGNLGAGTDDLISKTLDAGLIATNARGLEFTGWGTFGATANAKSVLVTFGATAITVIDAVTDNTGHWRVTGEIIRLTGTTQLMAASGNAMTNTGTGLVAAAKTGSPGETLANAIVLKFQGIGTADNDVRQLGLIIKTLGL